MRLRQRYRDGRFASVRIMLSKAKVPFGSFDDIFYKNVTSSYGVFILFFLYHIMAKRLSSPILLPIFGGQGTLSFNPEDGSRRFRQLTSSPTGVVLLDACFDAFHAELASLPVEVAQQVDICANDFLHKNSLLCPVREEYLLNPIISGSTLLLLQVSSFLHYVESSSAPRNNRLDWLLQSNAQHGIGVLGFSSGIIAATVVAASRTKLDFIRHAVEAYRLAFWIGVRSQLFRMSYYASNSTGIFQDFRPWALVIFSLDRSAVQQALLSFNEVCFFSLFRA